MANLLSKLQKGALATGLGAITAVSYGCGNINYDEITLEASLELDYYGEPSKVAVDLYGTRIV